VPSGTRSSSIWPAIPARLLPWPCLPLPARACGREWKSSRVCTPSSTTRTTSPPFPPFPPSGPPSGLNFSRCIEAQPLPPLPAERCIVARSTNRDAIAYLPMRKRGVSATHPALRKTNRRSDLSLVNIHGLAAILAAEPHRTRLQSEQRVVGAAPDVHPGMELCSALANQNLARVDILTTEALHTEPLRYGIASVAGVRRTLLRCHAARIPTC